MDSKLQQIDFSSILEHNAPPSSQMPRRSQIYLGFKCSQGCGFCYYKSRCNQSMLPLEQVQKEIDFKLRYGIRDFELTGGEPGEASTLIPVCQYIRARSPKSKIAVITNGALACQRDAFNLVDEVLVSYHLERGASVYDKQMFPHGSTWSKVEKTVQLARDHSLLVRTNTVLGTFNLDHLDAILDDIVQLRPAIVNFLPVNIFDEAAGMAEFIDYQKLRPQLKHAFQRVASELPEALTFARYMPFCQMHGFESHIVGYAQHIYDWFDWNVELGGDEIVTKLESEGEDKLLQYFGRYGSRAFESVFESRRSFYTKPKKCLACKYNLICDGIEKNVDQQLVERFAVPEAGKTTRNPIEFFKDQTHNLYNKLYAS